MSIPANIYPGAMLDLAHFGSALVIKMTVHSPEKQVICNVKTDDGQVLYLTPDYASSRAVVVA